MSPDWLLGGVLFAIYIATIVFYNVSHRRRKQRIERAINEVNALSKRYDERYVRASNLLRQGSSAFGEVPGKAWDVTSDLADLCLELLIERGLSDGEEQAPPEGTQEVAVEATRRAKVVVESPEPEKGHPQDG